MLLSRNVPDLGRVYYPLGAGPQFDDLIGEIGEYFRHGITLSPGDVVFDVGANIGAFALHAARLAGGGLKMYCFEPIPDVFSALEKNFLNSRLLASTEKHLFPCGVSGDERATEAVFHYFKRLPCDTTQHIVEKREEFALFFRNYGADLHHRANQVGGSIGATGRLAAQAVANFGSGPVSRFLLDQTLGLTELRCPLTTLERVVREHAVKRIDLLKVDVEGAEYEVLSGLADDSWQAVRQVVLEGHDVADRLSLIKGLLTRVGFDFVHCEAPALALDRGLNNFILYARRSAPS